MSAYKIDIMTLFPDAVSASLDVSILGRASKKGILDISCVQIRDYTTNKQQQVDDYPYGGGWGCVMMAQPLKACLDDIVRKAPGRRRRVIYMSPQGRTFNQETARRLLRDYDHLVLVCGHYEGIDERFIEECVDEEISVGDFVLTGGEIAAMAVTDCVCRMVPGVLADEECFTGESHWAGLLEYPQYTRPEVWEGRAVPQVLLAGNHENVSRWRRKKMLERTMDKRPDMFEKLHDFAPEDAALLAEIQAERAPKAPPKPEFDYHRAETADIPDIMEIVGDAQAFLRSCGVDQWQNGYPTAEAFENDIARGGCWVFTCKGETVGVATLLPGPESCYTPIYDGRWRTEGDNYFVIHRSAIRDGWRGSGLSGEIFSLCEELAAGFGAQSVRVDTHRDNAAMQGLLAKRGYERCGVILLEDGVEAGKERIAFEKLL